MKFILILIFTWHTPTMTTAEFDNKAACESAGKMVKEKYRNVDWHCVPKA